MRKECEQFEEGSRLRQICEGEADLPPRKIDTYRRRWGLEPIFGVEEEALPNERVRVSVETVTHERPSRTVRKVKVRKTNKSPNGNSTRPRKRCGSCGKKTKRNGVHRNVSKIGDYLHEIIHRETGKEIPCNQCRAGIDRLNGLNSAQVIKEKNLIVSQIVENSDQAPKFWQRLAVKIDKALSAGQTQLIVNRWVDEAIKRGQDDEAKRKVRIKRTRSRSAFSREGSTKARFISSEQFQRDIRRLCELIPADITAVVGVARSGLSAATMVSMYLHLPLLAIRQSKKDIIDVGNGWRLGGLKHVNPNEKKVVVIDDTVMTGNSLKALTPLAEKRFGECVTAAVYVNPLSKAKPDIHAVDLPWPHLLEWNLFNSVLSPNMAVDFDGILCVDAKPEQDDDGDQYLDFIQTARPLYLPRKVPIPLIVTARIEKYRTPTEQWLRRNRIKWKRLVMHPAPNLRERRKDHIPAFKARHFSAWAAKHRPKPGPLAFIESDDRQAKQIHELSNRMVICPHSGKVYE